MSEHVWIENTKPDRPGIWASKSSTGVGVTQFLDEDDLQSSWPGAWCFLMDLPDIKDPPKYRDVTPADVNSPIQVRNRDDWFDATCFSVSKAGRVAYENACVFGVVAAKFARILDDGQPAKQPREWWVRNGDLGGGLHCAYTQKPNYVLDGFTHVREVID